MLGSEVSRVISFLQASGSSRREDIFPHLIYLVKKLLPRLV